MESRSAPTSTTPTATTISVGSSLLGNTGKKPAIMATGRTADELRRNGLNMEKMIKKNVLAASRPGSLKRGLAVVEYFKAKNKQQQEENATVETNNSTNAAKKRRMLLDESPDTPSAVSSRSVEERLQPQHQQRAPSTVLARSTQPFTSPIRPSNSSQQLLSPPRPVRTAPNLKTLLASPVPGRSNKPPIVGASPVRSQRNSFASPLRRTDRDLFLTSPLRHRNASPRKPLLFADETMGSTDQTAASTMSAGTASTCSTTHSAQGLGLEQIEITAPSSKNFPSKSPFQSFQSKVNAQNHAHRSPVHPSAVVSSPSRINTGSSRQHAKESLRSGPGLVDFSHNKQASALLDSQSIPSVASMPGDPATAPSSTSGGPVAAPVLKPARALFSAPTIIANKSLCFSTEGVATSLDVSPDGEIIVVGFTDGSVRLYEMDSSVPSDRHGYLLGHIDEESSQRTSGANLRVKITSDGRYIFVGCRTGPRIVMSINLHNYRNEKENEDEEFEHLQKNFCSNSKLRGFSDVTKYIPPTGACSHNAYYILCGLGVGNLHMWRFVEARSSNDEPRWNHLYSITANGNTAMVAAFLPPLSVGNQDSSLSIAGICDDRNLRVWSLEHTIAPVGQEEQDSDDDGNSTGDDERNDDQSKAVLGTHTLSSHADIQNSKDVVAIHGKYAYGISPSGDAYRINLLDPSRARQHFEMEKFDNGGSGKSRRSMIMLESIFATDNGKVLIAVSTEGIFYYSCNVSEDPKEVCTLKIIGKNSSMNQQYKTPMRVYTPEARGKLIGTNMQPMMAVVTNPISEDEGGGGYFNVDPTEGFASRWMVRSIGRDCWVCGVRNMCHWQGPPEQQKTMVKRYIEEDDKEKKRRERREKRRQAKEAITIVDLVSPVSQRTSNSRSKSTTPSSSMAKKMASSTASAYPRLTSTTTAAPSGGPTAQDMKASGDKSVTKPRSRIEIDESDSNSDLIGELERYKERYNQIVMEWQRRLKGERQMRRLWKNRESEFNEQLDDALNRLDEVEQELARVQAEQTDSEKRYIFEKLKAEQQSSVKVRYEQLCEQMQEKIALMDDQKRLMEQTTRALLTEVERNVNSLKSAAILEKNECVVCKDKEAVTAIVPCGHLCFCEHDGEEYRRNSPVNNVVCPICQRELISLLRIY